MGSGRHFVLLSGLALLCVLQQAGCHAVPMVLTKGQHFKKHIQKARDMRKSQAHISGTSNREVEIQGTEISGRKLQQQRANAFSNCPSQRFIYPGTTMDSIFDQLSIQEFQSAAQAVADEYDFLIPYGYFRESSALTPISAPQSSTGLGGRGVTTNLTAAGQSGAPASAPDLNTDTSPGYFDPTNPVLNQNISQTDDYVYSAFLFPVNKTQALAYIDNSGPKPERFAKVIAIRGSVPDVMEYKVGPLPLGPASVVTPLYADKTIPYTKRPSNDIAEALQLGGLTTAVAGQLKNLSIAWIGQCGDATDADCQNNNITVMNVQVPTRELNRYQRIAAVIHFFQVGQGSSYELHNLPLSYKINTTSQDSDDWVIFEVEFCGQGFNNTDDLLNAYKRKKLTICKPLDWIAKNYNTSWAEDSVQQPARSANNLNLASPRTYEPAGKRFTLLQGDSPTSRVFQWGDWQAHVSSQPWTGLTFHDIRFKGDRIAYELSLNDQIVAYSGYSTVGQTFYLDSFDQLGASQYALKPGYDCPETAAYMPMNAMAIYGNTFTANESICFFESYGETTAWRHFDDNVNSVRQHAFAVRTVITLGNYDYIVSVFFHLDGSIKCQVHMAGHMQGLYFDTEQPFSKKEASYGTRVWTNTIGNLHDHLSSWKVDLDVKGVTNSFNAMAIQTGTYEQVLGKGQTPPWALPTDVMKFMNDTRVERETGFVLDGKVPTVYRFVNENSTNRWGQARGYGIFHGATTTQLLPNSHPLTKAAAWSKYHIAVTQRKENETQSGLDYYDSHSPIDPIFSLDMALNNESIVNQDLVAWVSMGIIHVPRTEDIPLISNIGVEFEIKPVNYFDRLASMDVQNSDDFAQCSAEQGLQSSFDYSYGNLNTQGVKAGFKFSGPLSSRDIFVNTTKKALAPGSALSPELQAASLTG